MKRRISLTLICCFLLAGCGSTSLVETTGDSISTATVQQETADPDAFFSQRDFEDTVDEAAVVIELASDGIHCQSEAVTVEGTKAAVTSGGTYLIRGDLADGSIVVDAKGEKVRLILSGANIHSSDSAPIYVRKADKVFVTLAQGTENRLSNGGSFAADDDDSIDGVIFCKADLTINGQGTLWVDSPAGHGIVSKDSLAITQGVIFLQAAAHGLRANDSLCIWDGSFTVEAGKDGLQAENSDDSALGYVYIAGGTFDVTAQSDGISASAYLLIDGGAFSFVTGGGIENAEEKTADSFGGMGGRPGSMGGRPGGMGGFPGGMGGSTDSTQEDDGVSGKGMKASGNLQINGGTFDLNCADDALHSNADLTVNGGSFTICTGDDGFHADELLCIHSGSICISDSYEGLEGQQIRISGGEISLHSGDDGLNAAGGNDQSGFGGPGQDMFGGNSDCAIEITGGSLFVDAGGDGIDSNGDLRISGGTVVVEGPTGGGNGALDYGGTGTVCGGTVIITGTMEMAQTLEGQGQGVLGISVGSRQAGTAIAVRDAQGNTLISAAPEKAYACIVVSCPEMTAGETYTVTVGQDSAELQAQ